MIEFLAGCLVTIIAVVVFASLSKGNTEDFMQRRLEMDEQFAEHQKRILVMQTGIYERLCEILEEKTGSQNTDIHD
jgi:cobalamin biosynthesis protein CbiG